MLNNVKKIKLKEINIKEGNILKYIDKNNRYFKKFGEIYFSEIKKGYYKGWNLHKRCQCLIFVPIGEVEFSFRSYNFKKKKRLIVKRSKPELLIIPPKIWFKFKSIMKNSLVVNLIDKVHNKNETIKKII